MNIQGISAFLAIYKYGSFSKAAEHLYMTQPTISWYISSLEKELGHPLFFRKRGQKGIMLTDAGKIFYPQAVKWEALWNETKTLLETKAYTEYSFATIHSLSHQLIPFLHAYFQEALPDCSLSLTTRPSPMILTGVENKEYDAGLTVISPATDRAVITQIASEKLVFVCKKDAPYPGEVCIRDLSISDHICIDWTEGLKDWRQQHFYGKPYAQLSSFDSLISFFQKPEIWTILPYSSYYAMKEELRICSLDTPPGERPFYLVTPVTPKEPFHSLLLDALMEFLKPFGDGIRFFSTSDGA